MSASLNGQIIIWKLIAGSEASNSSIIHSVTLTIDKCGPEATIKPPLAITSMQFTPHDRRLWCCMSKLLYLTYIKV